MTRLKLLLTFLLMVFLLPVQAAAVSEPDTDTDSEDVRFDPEKGERILEIL